MKELINKLLRDWSYRVHDGMPNHKNPVHLIDLKNLMLEQGYSFDVIETLLNNLRGNTTVNLVYEGRQRIKRTAAIGTDMLETAALVGLFTTKQPYTDLLLSHTNIAKSDKAKIIKDNWNAIIDKSEKALKELKKGLNKNGDWNANGASIINGLVKLGYVCRVQERGDTSKVSAYKNNFKVSLGALYQHDKFRKAHSCSYPQSFFENSIEFKIKDRTFNIPGPVDEYLSFLYKDWKTPINSENVREYNQDYLYQGENKNV